METKQRTDPQDPLLPLAGRPMRRLLAYLGPYRIRFWFAVGASVANKVMDLMPPLLVAWLIDTLAERPPGFMVSILGTGDRWTVSIGLAVLAVVIFLFESVFQWMYQYGFLTLAQKLQHDLRMDAYNQVQLREIAFFEEHRTGEILAMLNDDVNQLERFLNNAFNEIVQVVVLFVFASAVLFQRSIPLALVGMWPLPIVVFGSLLYQKRICPRYARVRRAVGSLASRLENNISGILVIKSFTAEPFESRRVRDASEEYRAANFEAIKLNALYVPLIRMAIALGFAGVLLMGGYWIINRAGVITLGGLTLFSMMIQRLLWPLTRLGTTLDEFERAMASARRTFGLLDTKSAIRDPETARDLGRADGAIAFENVSFTYPRGLPVLNEVSFRVAPGETLGIAGPTGAGKSTLIKLLLRLYDGSQGRVTLDGHDVRTLRVRELRNNIALVSQDVYLFHGTIRENIAYRINDVSLNSIMDASKLAQLHEFVQTLPQGYDTIVGERGIKLSGGQRQRLSIARAILKDAPILILDEATSSVDTETERAIQYNLRKITAGRTALVIAHRLSTIRNADRIIVLRNGAIEQEGHHDDLLTRGGTYADLWSIQSGQAAPSSGRSTLPGEATRREC